MVDDDGMIDRLEEELSDPVVPIFVPRASATAAAVVVDWLLLSLVRPIIVVRYASSQPYRYSMWLFKLGLNNIANLVLFTFW